MPVLQHGAERPRERSRGATHPLVVNGEKGEREREREMEIERERDGDEIFAWRESARRDLPRSDQ